MKKEYSFRNLTFHPVKLSGNWDFGFSMDIHTVSSSFLGVNGYGNNRYSNSRSEIGEAVYQLKYKHRQEYVKILSEAAAYAVREIILKAHPVDLIISVPPSKSDRDKQPVIRIAEAISGILNIEFNDSMICKTIGTEQMKDVSKWERTGKIKNAFTVNKSVLYYKNILLFDDLYQSGATAKECTRVLKQEADNIKVFLMTLTKTRT